LPLTAQARPREVVDVEQRAWSKLTALRTARESE
jgi:hypothetical protein